MNFYDFTVKDYLGNDVKLDKYKGKVILVVNTATKCGHTKQYDALEKFYEEYKDKGFVILDFPCNQFFKQAPGTEEEIHNFCVMKFNVAFPQFKKVDVNGENAEPLFTFLKNECPVNQGKRIKWNFNKFLIDREGNIVNRFEPAETIDTFKDKILELL